MVVRSLRRPYPLAAGVFVAATAVLAVQLGTPPSVTVTVGESGVSAQDPGPYFEVLDVAIIGVAACLFGASGTYILVAERQSADATTSADDAGVGDEREATPADALDARREEWEQTAERLANTERVVYETVLDADGVLPQSDVVDRTDLSKATVSRTLDALEAKNLLERKQRGMGNVVVLT